MKKRNATPVQKLSAHDAECAALVASGLRGAALMDELSRVKRSHGRFDAAQLFAEHANAIRGGWYHLSTMANGMTI